MQGERPVPRDSVQLSTMKIAGSAYQYVDDRQRLAVPVTGDLPTLKCPKCTAVA